MYVYFDVNENTMLDVMRTIVLPSNVDLLAKKGGVPVLMGLADEAGFPHTGYVNFGNNTVNASTGTITLRGVFDNPATPAGKRLLRPGMFVRVRLPLGKPHPSLLVSEKALQSDQGQKYPPGGQRQGRRRVPPRENRPVAGRRPARDLGRTEARRRVIVDGLQMVRPEMTVKVDEVPMPVDTGR